MGNVVQKKQVAQQAARPRGVVRPRRVGQRWEAALIGGVAGGVQADALVAGLACFVVAGKKRGPFCPQPDSSNPALTRAARASQRGLQIARPRIRGVSNMSTL